MAERWSNKGGAGDRSSLITISRTATGGSGPISNAVDGDYSESATGSWDWTGGQSAREIKLDFGSFPKKITKAIWYRSNVLDSDGFWKLTASNDDASYVDISNAIEIVGTTRYYVFDSTGTNDGYYRYYKFVQTSGTTSSAAWHQELEFLISGQNSEDDGPAVTPDYTNVQGTGERRGKIAISGTITWASGDKNVILNGTMGDSTWLTASQTGRYIEFDFFNPVLITELKWYQSTAASQGTWKLQGYDEVGATWEDIGSTFNLGATATTTVTAISGATEYYSKYRLQQVSGSTSSSPYIREIEFKVGYPDSSSGPSDGITSVTPDQGPIAGGTPVALVGVGFTGATGVLFDTDPATSVVVTDDENITCVTPAHATGLVDVTVERPTTDLVKSGAFTFIDESEGQPVRATQIPLLVVDQPNSKVRLTQAPVLILTLPDQPVRATQIPVLAAIIPEPIPLPSPVVPELPVSETWQWSTIVNISHNGKEQRAALRQAPRIGMKFNALFVNDADRQAAYQLIMQYIKRVFNYPLYTHSTRLTALSAAGATKLYFDPSETDMRDGEPIALFDPYFTTTLILPLATVDADGATLAGALLQDVPAYWLVCPAPRFRSKPSMGLQMEAVQGDFSLDLTGIDPRPVLRPGQADTVTIYDGLPVLSKRTLADDDVNEDFSQSVTWLDNEINEAIPFADWTVPFFAGDRSYLVHRPDGLDYWRSFADKVKGRQNPFLLPTFRDDLPLAAVPALSATIIKTSNTQFFDFWRFGAYRYIQIKSDAGVIYRRIQDVTPNYSAEGKPISLDIKLSSSIGAAVGSNANMIVSYANLCRLDSDEILLSHGPIDTVVTIRVRAINE